MSKFNELKLKKLRIIDGIFRLIYLNPKNKKSYPKIDKTEVNEIVLLGIWLIGDTIMHLPVINVIKKNFPKSRITIVCEKQTEIILKNQNLVDNFILFKCPWVVPTNYSIKNVFNFFYSIKKVNQIHYDLAIEFRGDWRSIFYMNFIKSKRKISYNYSGGEYMLTDVIEPDYSINNLIYESLHLLKSIGCDFRKNDEVPILKLNQDDFKLLNEFKLENNLNGKFVIGIHPGTTQIVKRWDENKYAELIIKLNRTYNNTVFLIYEGPNESNTVLSIQKVLDENKINYLKITRSLIEYIKFISLSQIMVCNDSGASHIAGAYNIPLVVIFGSRGAEFVFPFGSQTQAIISHNLDCKPCLSSTCKLGTLLCLTSISVDEVYLEVNRVVRQAYNYKIN